MDDQRGATAMIVDSLNHHFKFAVLITSFLKESIRNLLSYTID